VDNPLDGFYATKLRESLGLGSTASVRAPVEMARQVLLDALAELYTVTVTRSDARGWQPDVEVFDLRCSGRSGRGQVPHREPLADAAGPSRDRPGHAPW